MAMASHHDKPPVVRPLGERATEAMCPHHPSLLIQNAYLSWMLRYHDFNHCGDPAQFGADDHVAASTQNQALAALL